ncbi:DNA polymerase III beta subunit, C-terminal domain [Micromonospora yangpuensis]|uniref:DNA polymerase III beta subunit, C-terminal domain n=1 Tax=Micromonospora yangpuensis TaxID=683228 RepID=A0A1C6V2F7_9ACTN|nr:DNA polymerase III beta subunit, C-terminal domain [Micromonospora yangpuensis]
MGGDLHSIGEFARASGLSVSALRFYDRSGILTPALVDPATGYRWYADEQVLPARLVAGLRRVGMPLADIAAALRRRDEPAAVHRLLDAHLRRLEDGLTDARRELARVRALLEPVGAASTTRLVLSGAELAAAVDAVRFAAGVDPDLPMLAGVLVDVDSDEVRLVATDRHRLAVARTPARVAGAAVRALLPLGAVDELRALLATGPDGTVSVEIAPSTVAAVVGDRTIRATALPYDFPDYRRLLRRTVDDREVRRIPFDVPALRAALHAVPVVVREHDGVAHPLTVLGVDAHDGLRPLTPAEASVADGELRIGVNKGYLLDALDAAGDAQLVLELDGPVTPLAIRRPTRPGTFSVLMPIHL